MNRLNAGIGSLAMDQRITEPAPTSSATTRRTEPDVVAAILSAEGHPAPPLALCSGRLAWGIAGSLLLLAGAMALGYGATGWRRERV